MGRSLRVGVVVSTLASVLVSAALVGCDRGSAPSADSSAEPNVGTIDGQPISRAAFVDALLAAQGDAFFPRYVERQLAEREAAAAGVTVSADDVKAEVDAEQQRIVAGRFRGDEAAFAESLAGYGLDLESWRAQLADRVRIRLLVQKLLVTRVDEDRVRKLFELRYGEGGVQRRISHIFLTTVPAASRLYTRADFEREKAAIAEQAAADIRAIKAKVDDGADFAALAREESDDVSSIDGGDLGAMWSGRFGAGFDAAVGALDVGGVSDVIISDKGAHVLQVTGVRKGATYEGRAIVLSAKPRGGRDARSEEQRFAEALVEARAVKARLDAGDDFAAVATRASSDPVTRARGGDLGKFSPGRLGRKADPVLETLPIGAVSEPVRTAEGYVVIQLSARTFLPGQDKKTVRHIMRGTTFPRVKARKLGPVIEARARAKADALLIEARAEGADFAALARRHSEDESTRRNGGRINRMRAGQLGASADAAISEMKVGEVRLIEADKGFQLVRLDGLVESDFADVRAKLEAELKQKPIQPEDVENHLRRLREKAEVVKSF